MNELITLENVSKRFGNRTLFDQLTLTISKGKVLGVIGHNGAGKTSLFKLLLQMYQPSEGSIKIHDKNLDIKNDIGYLPEQRGLYLKNDIYSQLLSLGYLKGKTKKELIKTIDYWLDFFGITKNKYDILGNLSKGNQQKVQFIVSVIHNPKLLILDEPFSGLDPINVDLFIKAIREINKGGSTILYSSHEMGSVEDISDQIMLIKNGEIVFYDTLINIQEKYGFYLRVKNKSLTQEILEMSNFKYREQNGDFLISIDTPDEAEKIHELLPDKYSETFKVEKFNLEEIFKTVNEKG